MQKTKIDWPGLTHTWNPVTGCKRGCSYCYAKKIHDRFNKTEFSNILLHKERISQPYKEKKPAKIFVGSMSDCQYWSDEAWDRILPVVRECKQHTFMFLTKDSIAYKGIEFPMNCMCGLTLTGNESEVYQFQNTCYLADTVKRPFLSIEPLLGRMKIIAFVDRFELIIVGAMTGAGAVKPEKDWIEVFETIPKTVPIHFKSSMKKYL